MANRKQAAAGSGGRAKTVRLNEAAAKQVEDHAPEIAEALMNGARNGNCMSIRLLIQLAEAGADAKEALEAHPLLSLAMRLAADPEMPDGAADDKPKDEKQAQN